MYKLFAAIAIVIGLLTAALYLDPAFAAGHAAPHHASKSANDHDADDE